MIIRVETPQELTAFLTDYRQDRGVKLQYIAEHTGRRITTISDNLNNKTRMTVDTMLDIAHLLDLDVAFIHRNPRH
jgi:transcriptional regulator with XRE-family HTH domain